MLNELHDHAGYFSGADQLEVGLENSKAAAAAAAVNGMNALAKRGGAIGIAVRNGGFDRYVQPLLLELAAAGELTEATAAEAYKSAWKDPADEIFLRRVRRILT